MTVEQVAINAKAIRNAAARLEAKGYDGDATAFCESLIVAVLADGYARIDPPPALRGPTSTKEGRARAKALFEEAMREKAGH